MITTTKYFKISSDYANDLYIDPIALKDILKQLGKHDYVVEDITKVAEGLRQYIVDDLMNIIMKWFT